MTSVLFDPKVDITLSSTYRRLWSADIYRHAISPLRLINGQNDVLKIFYFASASLNNYETSGNLLIRTGKSLS